MDGFGLAVVYFQARKREERDEPLVRAPKDAAISPGARYARRFAWMRAIWDAVRRRLPQDDVGGRPLGLGRDPPPPERWYF